VQIQGVKKLPLIDDWCSVGFINPIGVVADVRRQNAIFGTSLNKRQDNS
jgi:hypothetical protein